MYLQIKTDEETNYHLSNFLYKKNFYIRKKVLLLQLKKLTICLVRIFIKVGEKTYEES